MAAFVGLREDNQQTCGKASHDGRVGEGSIVQSQTVLYWTGSVNRRSAHIIITGKVEK